MNLFAKISRPLNKASLKQLTPHFVYIITGTKQLRPVINGTEKKS